MVEPAFAIAFKRDEVLHIGRLVADALDGLKVIGMRANDLRAAVAEDVGEVIGGEAEIDRHGHRADLRHGVVAFEMCVCVRRDECHAIAGLYTKRLQACRPFIATLKKLRVGQPRVSIDDGFTLRIEAAGTAGEIEGSERCFHDEGVEDREMRRRLTREKASRLLKERAFAGSGRAGMLRAS